jgi:hypothetical protein
MGQEDYTIYLTTIMTAFFKETFSKFTIVPSAVIVECMEVGMLEALSRPHWYVAAAASHSSLLALFFDIMKIYFNIKHNK